MRTALALLAGLCGLGLAWALTPREMLCEWLPHNMTASDPCPEFSWEAEGQQAYRLLVATSETLLRQGRGDLWDSGCIRTSLPIAEYAGPPLVPQRPYFWAVQLWDERGPGDFCAPQRFAIAPRVLPRKRPHLRAFVNYGENLDVIARTFDLTFYAQARERDPNILALTYCLVATLVVPSEKAQALERFCREKGLAEAGIPERMFLHYAEDTPVRLHVGAERADRPVEERIVPGWDPANDRNGDGRVDDEEFAQRVNPRASAREWRQARVPIYYWGPPADDYVMNVADPDYQEFIATRYVEELLRGANGLMIDTTSPLIPGAHGKPLGEFSLAAQAAGAWRHAMQLMLARIKKAHPEALLIGNGWDATPFVIDGVEWENWLNITMNESQLQEQWERVTALDRRGKIQLCQYNGLYDPQYAEFGVKAPVSRERDQIFGLAAYYLVAGDYTYYGRGQHPYRQAERQWIAAAEYDIGQPRGARYVWAQKAPDTEARPNLLPNGGFERDADGDGKPDGWEIAAPLVLDTVIKHSGRQSVRIDSDSEQINNINKAWLELKPHTTYTLSAWIKTEGVGGQGAQVYAYGFEGMSGNSMLVAKGTTDWRHYSSCFTTGAGTRGRISFRLYDTRGKAWLDDLSLVEGVAIGYTIYARDFERALVLLRPFAGVWGAETAAAITLPAPLRPLQADGGLGMPTTTIALEAGEAAILVR